MSSTTITIKILFFASAREAAGGISSANLELEADSADTKLLRWVLFFDGWGEHIKSQWLCLMSVSASFVLGELALLFDLCSIDQESSPSLDHTNVRRPSSLECSDGHRHLAHQLTSFQSPTQIISQQIRYTIIRDNISDTTVLNLQHYIQSWPR